MEDALAFPLLLPGRDHILRGMLTMGPVPEPSDQSTHECLSLHALHAGLRLGLGATLISKFSALPLIRTGDVLWRPISDPVVTRQLFIMSSSERPKTTAQQTVVRMVEDLILESVASGDLPGVRLRSSE